MIEDILKHFESEYPREACGVIASGKYYPCKNVAEGMDDFIISSEDYIKISSKETVTAIVHSHPDYGCEASKADIDSCNAIGIPYYIYSYPDMELNILEPVEVRPPLVGRQYKFGTRDCFAAARDYYFSKGILINNRLPFEDNWWEKGLDYMSEDSLKYWGFKKVTNLLENDLLVFRMSANVNNHCGVYTGKDMFFHHAYNRLSCFENLYPLWKKYLTGIYRYEA